MQNVTIISISLTTVASVYPFCACAIFRRSRFVPEYCYRRPHPHPTPTRTLATPLLTWFVKMNWIYLTAQPESAFFFTVGRWSGSYGKFHELCTCG